VLEGMVGVEPTT